MVMERERKREREMEREREREMPLGVCVGVPSISSILYRGQATHRLRHQETFPKNPIYVSRFLLHLRLPYSIYKVYYGKASDSV